MQFLENSISRVYLNLWLHIQSQFTSLRRVMLKDIPLQLVTFQNDKSRREWIYSPPCSIGRTYWKSRFRDNLYTVAFYQKILDTHGKLRCIHLYYGISNKPKFWKNVFCMTSFGIIKFNKYRENHFIDGVTFVE